MYLLILKNPRFLLAGTSFVCVCVCPCPRALVSKPTLKMHQIIWSLALSAKWTEGSMPSCSSPLDVGGNHKNTSSNSTTL